MSKLITQKNNHAIGTPPIISIHPPTEQRKLQCLEQLQNDGQTLVEFAILSHLATWAEQGDLNILPSTVGKTGNPAPKCLDVGIDSLLLAVKNKLARTVQEPPQAFSFETGVGERALKYLESEELILVRAEPGHTTCRITDKGLATLHRYSADLTPSERIILQPATGSLPPQTRLPGSSNGLLLDGKIDDALERQII